MNIKDLTEELADAFRTVRKNPKFAPQAKQMANIAGSILKAQRLQIDYAAARKEQPDIEFLNTQNKK
jgi:hypothetical protein